MSNDAKLGLVMGVAIVLVIGLVFFRADPPLAAQIPAKGPTVTAVMPSDAEQAIARHDP